MTYLIQNLSFLNSITAVQALWLFWLLMLFLFIIISLVLSYQWRHFGVQNSNLRFGEFIYYIIAVIFLGFGALSIILFNANF